MDLATELTEATGPVRAGGTLAERLTAAVHALLVARRAITVLEENGDPAGFAGYAMAAIEIIEAGHAIRRAPALGVVPEVEASAGRNGRRVRSTAAEAEVRALVELAEALEEGFTGVAEAAPTVNDRLACLAVAGHAARWRDVLVPEGTDGDLR